MFIDYPDRRLQKIEVSTDIYKLTLRVAADPNCEGQLRLEPRLDEAGARLLINPVSDHDDEPSLD